jgi:hypothetical protein
MAPPNADRLMRENATNSAHGLTRKHPLDSGFMLFVRFKPQLLPLKSLRLV